MEIAINLMGGLALFLYGMQMMSGGLEAPDEIDFGKINDQSFCRNFIGLRGHYDHSIVISHHSHGGWFCECANDGVATSGLGHHGC